MTLCQYVAALFLVTSESNIFWQKTYVCTSDALARGDCTREQLGRFILDFPQGKTINDTSFWSARVLLSTNPAPLPAPAARNLESGLVNHGRRENPNPSPDSVLSYSGTINYHLTKTGYYCVGANSRYPNYPVVSTLSSSSYPTHLVQFRRASGVSRCTIPSNLSGQHLIQKHLRWPAGGNRLSQS
jgi:hypothetical protein